MFLSNLATNVVNDSFTTQGVALVVNGLVVNEPISLCFCGNLKGNSGGRMTPAVVIPAAAVVVIVGAVE